MTSSSSESSISLRPPLADDREPVCALLVETAVFRPEEVAVALEVLDGAIEQSGYLGLIAERDGEVLGVALWGAAPMTEGTYDLYWIAAHPSSHGSGVGAALLDAVIDDVARRFARLLLVETESTPPYARARAFYERSGLTEIARIPEYYRPGADKVVFALGFEGAT